MSGIPHELPSEAIPAAVGVFTYSFICLILSFGLLWATLAHGEYTSYVALLATYTSLSTLASMGQQLHTYPRWTSIKLAQADHVRDNIANPELSIAGPSVGIDLIFFYIQFYCYNVMAILVVSWCTQLTYSVYHVKASPSRGVGGYIAKLTAVCLPAVQTAMLRTKVLQSNLVAFYLVANVIMGFSLSVGTILLLAILARYISTRAETSWRVHYGSRSVVDKNDPHAGNLASQHSLGNVPLHKKSIYDNWLVVRFTLAFAGLSAFQLVVIMTEVGHALDNHAAAATDSVDLSTGRAVGDIQGFLPGASASLLAFVVFGTTKTIRDFFYLKLVPRALRRRQQQYRQRNSRTIPLSMRRRTGAATARVPGLGPGGQAAPAMYPRSPGLPATPGSECFELEGGLQPQPQSHELAVATPVHEVFPQHKKLEQVVVVDDDRWPVLDKKPGGLG